VIGHVEAVVRVLDQRYLRSARNEARISFSISVVLPEPE
jgi:hypothetical protein